MSSWTPKLVTTRRIAGRILRVSRAGYFELGGDETQVCIDAITNKFLSTSLRQRIGVMWSQYGPFVVQSGAEDPERRSEVDDSLDKLVQGPNTK